MRAAAAAFANVYVGLGDKERAFFWLEKAYEERSYYIAYMNVFPILDPLRSDPRFDNLLQRVGLRKLQFRTEQVSALVSRPDRRYAKAVAPL